MLDQKCKIKILHPPGKPDLAVMLGLIPLRDLGLISEIIIGKHKEKNRGVMLFITHPKAFIKEEGTKDCLEKICEILDSSVKFNT